MEARVEKDQDPMHPRQDFVFILGLLLKNVPRAPDDERGIYNILYMSRPTISEG